MTFDEWWNKEAGPKGRWVGDYETDAEANARIGWEAALSHSSEVRPTTPPSEETLLEHATLLANGTLLAKSEIEWRAKVLAQAFLARSDTNAGRELERLREFQSRVEEAEARCCPEDVGFEEWIGILQKRLSTANSATPAKCQRCDYPNCFCKNVSTDSGANK
jgi:hypothetical protein